MIEKFKKTHENWSGDASKAKKELEGNKVTAMASTEPFSEEEKKINQPIRPSGKMLPENLAKNQKPNVPPSVGKKFDLYKKLEEGK